MYMRHQPACVGNARSRGHVSKDPASTRHLAVPRCATASVERCCVSYVCMCWFLHGSLPVMRAERSIVFVLASSLPPVRSCTIHRTSIWATLNCMRWFLQGSLSVMRAEPSIYCLCTSLLTSASEKLHNTPHLNLGYVKLHVLVLTRLASCDACRAICCLCTSLLTSASEKQHNTLHLNLGYVKLHALEVSQRSVQMLCYSE